MTVNWKGLLKVAAQIPVVKRALGATLEELERNPDFQKFVESYQGLAQRGGQVDCMICLAHAYGVKNRINTFPEPPRHRCSNRGGIWFP